MRLDYSPRLNGVLPALDAIERKRRVASEIAKRLTAQLALLAEHRQALITAAVTGHLAVPGVVA